MASTVTGGADIITFTKQIKMFLPLSSIFRCLSDPEFLAPAMKMQSLNIQLQFVGNYVADMFGGQVKLGSDMGNTFTFNNSTNVTTLAVPTAFSTTAIDVSKGSFLWDKSYTGLTRI